MEGTDQGLVGLGRYTRRRLEDQPANRRGCRLGPEVVSGFDPSYSILLMFALRRMFSSLWPGSYESGGDEETRTPDPLLAKEMLCQLSYVPVRPG